VSNNTQILYKSQVVNIINIDGTFRVDSRLIAQRLRIQHRNFIENIRKYSSEFHQLGILPFQTEEINGRGQPEKYALLNEDQTLFALTLSRNTPEVVQLKLDLTVAFRNARQVATQSAEKMVMEDHRSDTQEQTLTISDIAKRLAIKPRQVNPILTKIGLQTANRDHKERLYTNKPRQGTRALLGYWQET